MPAEFDRLARAVEELAYDSLWTGDHVVFPSDVRSPYPYNATGAFPFDRDQPLFEPLGLLAYLAGRTTTVRLSVSVLVLPMRNPLVTARMLAGIDALARGRLELGIGVGWLREEFEALAADFAARAEVTEEWIAILRQLWTAGSPAAFDGRHYRFPPLALVPRPESRIPILIGGNSLPALRRAARVGDGWHGVRLAPARVREAVTRLRAGLVEAGRDAAGFRVVLRASVTPDDAARQLESYAEAGVDELIVEVPDASTDRRLHVLAAVREARRRL
ncbi:MAG TPA: TIGR03619 family F420-dependent LLM class oxidoreductase [Candidatus Eisenbacteria bacterium]|nr:TIGR03619 family F420-dependent LLM class oxidoreductase [Candidatus Eisenbacteria bacterium]